MNTPRTDREIWWVGFKPDERLEAVWADFARDLEKENAALRDAIEESEEFARKNGETCGSKIRELLAENAALRADKERLDYMEQNVDFVSWRFYGKPQLWNLRAAIDRKMKEAQP